MSRDEVLNAEGVPSPSGGTRWAAKRRGWAESTISVMLSNEKYIGIWRWNKTRSQRRSDRRARRQVARPATDWKVSRLPGTAIIPEGLWDSVQKQRQRVSRGGRPSGTGKHEYLLSGLLRCGACHASMSVVGAKLKNGRRYARFGCAAHYHQGDAVCRNNLTIGTDRIAAVVLQAITDLLASPDLSERFVAAVRDRLSSETSARRDPASDVLAQIPR